MRETDSTRALHVSECVLHWLSLSFRSILFRRLLCPWTRVYKCCLFVPLETNSDSTSISSLLSSRTQQH